MKARMKISRRRILAGGSILLASVTAPPIARTQQAQWAYKYANNLPDAHPMNVRAKEMSAAIKAETNGRFDLQIFPNNQLGSDTDMLSQIRSGGIEFFTLSGLILATLVPAASYASRSRSPALCVNSILTVPPAAIANQSSSL